MQKVRNMCHSHPLVARLAREDQLRKHLRPCKGLPSSASVRPGTRSKIRLSSTFIAHCQTPRLYINLIKAQPQRIPCVSRPFEGTDQLVCSRKAVGKPCPLCGRPTVVVTVVFASGSGSRWWWRWRWWSIGSGGGTVAVALAVP